MSKTKEKRNTLKALYKSLQRMNDHILKNNTPGYISEYNLQRNLRKIFVSSEKRD